MIGRLFRRLLSVPLAPLYQLSERQLVLQAQVIAEANRKLRRVAGLHSVEFCATSQWGEDGIIDWLVSKIPEIPPVFVEFGVQDYRESNTRLLLQTHNWRGLVMDGSAAHVADIQRQNLSWRHDLTAKCAFIDRENINRLTGDAGFDGPIGLLSIDVDGNDYWLWDAIDGVSPAIVVCEYNAVLGDLHSLVVPYRADFQRGLAHHSNLYFGASVRALIVLARRKGYEFVGTTSTGCNAFFVRKDLASPVIDAVDHIWAFPSRVRESRDATGQLTLVGGEARMSIIDHLPLVDIEKNADTTLGDLDEVYSFKWAEGIGAVWG